MSGPPSAADRPRAEAGRERPILVIRLGALGDFVLSMGAFAAIRRHHSGARITLLTTAPFQGLARASGYFDDVWLDERPRAWQIGRWLGLRRRLRSAGFARVYDLQTSDRTGFYFRLLGPGRRPQWSGIARGCSHPDDNPERRAIHTVERQRAQLRRAGIAAVGPPDLGWVVADGGRFGLAAPYALLVPGGAPHRPAKRWPAARYADLALLLAGDGVRPVVIGGPAERPMGAAIVRACGQTCDLTGKTGYGDIVALAREAALAVGNDTGPMHLIALAGCPTLVLFGAASDPARTAPRAPRGRPEVVVLRAPDLGALAVDEVWSAAARMRAT